MIGAPTRCLCATKRGHSKRGILAECSLEELERAIEVGLAIEALALNPQRERALVAAEQETHVDVVARIEETRQQPCGSAQTRLRHRPFIGASGVALLSEE